MKSHFYFIVLFVSMAALETTAHITVDCNNQVGLENEDTSCLYFCKNNVFIIIESTTIFSKGLYEKIASIIQIAPVWSSGSSPSFIVSKEFVNYFQRKDHD